MAKDEEDVPYSLVFVTGGFSSGSTLLFTLFRKSGLFHCLYEPLHEHLAEFFFVPLRIYEHHYHVRDYFSEYQGYSSLPRLFDPRWGTSNLRLSPKDTNAELYRYLCYLVGMSFARKPRVLLQFNRATFRLGWLRARFPDAAVVHIYRDCAKQWASIVRRTQVATGRLDVGQDAPTFNGMGIATRCDDLASDYPELAADQSVDGYGRFQKLWQVTYAENQRHADLSISFHELTSRFDETVGALWEFLGCASDHRPLQQWVVRPGRQETVSIKRGLRRRLIDSYDRLRFRYARLRVHLARRPRSG